MNPHMRIGIFAGKVYREINQQQIKGILKLAYSLGYSASVFTLNEEYYDEKNDKGAYNIFNIVNFSKLDGIIYLPNTFSSNQCKKHVENFLDKNCCLPIVCTDVESKNYIPVWTDDRSEIAEVVSHLIEKHSCKKIMFLTGRDDMYSSHQRLAGYKDAMDNAGLAYSDEDIRFGDYWIYSGHMLGKDIGEGRVAIPDAVACANDCMAIFLCDTLRKYGIRVPEDVLITGYDGTEAAALNSPVITTYHSSWEQLGTRAMHLLYKEMTGKNAPEIESPCGELICGESCGCTAPKHNPYLVNFNYEKFEGDYQDSSISTTLLSAKTYRDFIVQLYSLLPYFLTNSYAFDPNDDIKNIHYCLCLCEDWRQNKLDGYKDTYRTQGYSKRILATDKLDPHVIFDAADMLPPHILGMAPSVTYFSPCHFSDRCFGYNTITFPGQTCTFDLRYLRLCREVNNGLAFLVIQDELKGLAYSSHVARSRDLLTGLYNLKSFPQIWEEIKETATMSDEEIFMTAISISGLQTLLELSGTREKEMFIVSFSEMLMKCCNGHVKFFRIGDGDFAIIGSGDNAADMIESVSAEINNRFIELDDVSNLSGSIHIRHRSCTVERNRLPIPDDARKQLLDLIDTFNYDKTTRTEQIYFKELVVLRREIFEFPERDWSLSACCDKLSISNNYFQKIYKRTFGVTCMHDIQKSKLDYAKKLLTHTNDTLQIIAERCGYNYSHFMRMFKKETGITPTQYRSGKNKNL